MDKKTAANLLVKIREKKADGIDNEALQALQAYRDSLIKKKDADLNNQALNQLARYLIGGMGAGAAIRGLSHFVYPPKPVDESVEHPDLSMPIPVKKADDDVNPISSKPVGPTKPYGLPWYLPAVFMGAPLAAAGGWKLVDSLLDKQQQAKADDELEAAKKEYQDALNVAIGVKSAGDNAEIDKYVGSVLDNVYEDYQNNKGLAGQISDALSSTVTGVSNYFNNLFPNMSGVSKGLLLSYALGSGALGYHGMSKWLSKSNKVKRLQLALNERARRRLAQQPAAIYVRPEIDEDDE